MKSKTKTTEKDEQKPLTAKEKEERDKVIDNLLERTKTLLGEKEVGKLFAVLCMGGSRVGRRGSGTPLENYKLLYFALEILVGTPLRKKLMGPIAFRGRYCTALCEIY